MVLSNKSNKLGNLKPMHILKIKKKKSDFKFVKFDCETGACTYGGYTKVIFKILFLFSIHNLE